MLKGQFMSKTIGILSGAVAALAIAAGPALAEPETPWPTRFTCKFDAGTRGTFEGGKFNSSSATPLSFDITDVDLEKQEARLRTAGSEAPGTLRVVRAINANHFLEVVPEGFLNLTTIYDDKDGTGEHPAVHSRHLGVLGQPLFSQYSGICKAQK